MDTTGVMLWQNGDPMVYERYGKGEPAKGDDCVTIDRSDNYLWAGAKCTDSNLILCTKHIGKYVKFCQVFKILELFANFKNKPNV